MKITKNVAEGLVSLYELYAHSNCLHHQKQSRAGLVFERLSSLTIGSTHSIRACPINTRQEPNQH